MAGDRPDRIAAALDSDADAVIVDLCAAVHPDHRPEARRHAAALHGTTRQLWVRINPGRDGLADIDALAPNPPFGLVLGSCEQSEWVEQVADRIPAHVQLAPHIESARAVAAIDDICDHPRVARCHLGEPELLADLGAPAGPHQYGDVLLAPARTALVYAGARAGIGAPVGGVPPSIDDLEGLAESSRLLFGIGYSGRAVVHHGHCRVVNDAFRTDAG